MIFFLYFVARAPCVSGARHLYLLIENPLFQISRYVAAPVHWPVSNLPRNSHTRN